MDVPYLLAAVIASAAWVSLILRARELLPQHQQAPNAVLVVLGGLAVGLSFQSVAVHQIRPTAPLLASMIALVVAISVWQLLMLHLRHGRPLWDRRHVLVVLVAALTITVIAAASLLPSPYPQLARLADFAYLLASLPHIALHSRAAARVVTQPLTRLGLRLIAVATVSAAVCIAWPLTAILVHLITRRPPQPTPLVVTAATDAATLLGIVGLTLPAWGPRFRLDTPWRAVSGRRIYRALEPLWRDLVATYPHITLGVLPARGHGDRQLLRVHRRVVEIVDGIALLRPHLDRADTQRAIDLADAAGLDNATRTAVVTASSLAAGLERRAVNCLAAQESAWPPPYDHRDWETDAARLAGVSLAYRSHPLVDHVRAEVRSAVRRGDRGTPDDLPALADAMPPSWSGRPQLSRVLRPHRPS